MDLKQFVSTTLTQIVEGVEDAMISIAQMGNNAQVNPTIVNASDEKKITPASAVEFDVALTVTDEGKQSAGTKAGASVGILSVVSFRGSGSVENGETTTKASQNVSRVKFTVMLSQPGDVSEWAPQTYASPRGTNAWSA